MPALPLSQLKAALLQYPSFVKFQTADPNVRARAEAFCLWWGAKAVNLRTVDFRSGIPVPVSILEQLVGQTSQSCLHVRWSDTRYWVIGIDIWALPNFGDTITECPTTKLLVLTRARYLDLSA